MTAHSFDLSIIIVSWNTKDVTRDCLRSVYDNAGAMSLQVIVVDNASSDGSADMIRTEFPQAILIENPENVGFARANNQVMLQASGRYVLLLNSDTVVHGHVLQQSCAWLDQNHRYAAMGCRVLNTDGTVQETCFNYPSLRNLAVLTSGVWKLKAAKSLDTYLRYHWERDQVEDVETISGCYLMVRSECLLEVGLLDENFFFYGEETDWCRRLRDFGWKLAFAPVGEITHLGGASAKQLNHRRDVMLTEATVRLHRKHEGMLSAILCFLLLGVFNLSRAMYWSLRTALMVGGKRGRTRAAHFLRVVLNTGKTWPKEV